MPGCSTNSIPGTAHPHHDLAEMARRPTYGAALQPARRPSDRRPITIWPSGRRWLESDPNASRSTASLGWNSIRSIRARVPAGSAYASVAFTPIRRETGAASRAGPAAGCPRRAPYPSSPNERSVSVLLPPPEGSITATAPWVPSPQRVQARQPARVEVAPSARARRGRWPRGRDGVLALHEPPLRAIEHPERAPEEVHHLPAVGLIDDVARRDERCCDFRGRRSPAAAARSPPGRPRPVRR